MEPLKKCLSKNEAVGIQHKMINATAEPCKDYSGSPEEGTLSGHGEGDDGGSQWGEFGKPHLWTSCPLPVEGKTGYKNNPILASLRSLCAWWSDGALVPRQNGKNQ